MSDETTEFDFPIIANMTLDEIDFLIGQDQPNRITNSALLLRDCIERDEEEDHQDRKRRAWSSFREHLVDFLPPDQQHLHLAEIVGQWFYANYDAIEEQVDAAIHTKERTARGEVYQRCLKIGDKVAVTYAGGFECMVSKRFSSWIDYVGYRATLEDCISAAIERLPIVREEEPFEWAIVLAAEIVAVRDNGKLELNVTDPTEYHRLNIEPGKFYEHFGPQTFSNRGVPLGVPPFLAPRHRVSGILLYPNEDWPQEI